MDSALFSTLCLLISITISSPLLAECRRGVHHHRQSSIQVNFQETGCRAHSVSLTDFGAVGDGITSNTKAFQSAIDHLSEFENKGGGLLYVPGGKWLTAPFNLTASHFTLFLASDAEILATTNIDEWAIIDPLPSYGRGRDLPGGRYSNFIMGSNLTDIIITGNNGTINGQGQIWWDKFHQKQLEYTRSYLLEILYSDRILISNLTFVDSMSWNIHPIYCKNVVVSGITILAPTHSPNTDGIDPDSCSGVQIEDCYIVSGDDCIAIKSGWDEYGIKVNIPSEDIIIRRLTCISPTSAVIALGSEMSGGIRNVRAEDITAINSESGVRIKTAIGRGNYIKEIYVRRMNLHTMKWVFWMAGNYGQHPDDGWDPKAIPEISDISYSDVVAENVTMAGSLTGIPGDAFKGICMSNVTVEVIKSKKPIWNCTDIEGVVSGVSPAPCDVLQDNNGQECPFPDDRLEVEDVEFGTCYNK